MWRQIIAAVLLIAFVAQTFSKAIIVIDFYANQKYIAENLCINKDKPQMHCCGKCQLCKRLKQEDNKDKQNPERKNESKNEVLSSKSFFATVASLTQQEYTNEYPILPDSKEIRMPRSLFHPPGI